MRIEFLDGAGNRATDGSAVALAMCATLPPIISMFPEGRALTTQEWALVTVAFVGWVCKFIRIVP